MSNSISPTVVHSYHACIAKEVGANAAVIFYNICYWVAQNIANDKNFYDGYYWTHNTVESFSHLFPEFTKKQISTAIKRLEEEGYILSGNYNENPLAHEKWYTVRDEYFPILPVGKFDFTQRENDKYILYINHTKTDKNTLPHNYYRSYSSSNNNTHAKVARSLIAQGFEEVLKKTVCEDDEKIELIELIEKYNELYEAKTGLVHPRIAKSEIRRIVNEILNGDITIEEYGWIMEMHFENNYTKKIDYNLVHFMSGKTRELLIRRISGGT